MIRRLFQYAGWSTYVSAIGTITTFVSAILFFSIGQPFGSINDIASVLQVIFMLPLALVLYQVLRPHGQTLSFLSATLGITGILMGGVIQSLLVAGMITYQQTVPFFLSGAAIGGWLMLNNYLILTSHVLPRGLAWAGVLAGVGYIVTVAGFLLGGYQNPFFFAGGLLTVICYPTWALWLGRVLVLGNPAVVHAHDI